MRVLERVLFFILYKKLLQLFFSPRSESHGSERKNRAVTMNLGNVDF
jgi:hypothetical protein